jgi:hypothetical protein
MLWCAISRFQGNKRYSDTLLRLNTTSRIGWLSSGADHEDLLSGGTVTTKIVSTPAARSSV